MFWRWLDEGSSGLTLLRLRHWHWLLHQSLHGYSTPDALVRPRQAKHHVRTSQTDQPDFDPTKTLSETETPRVRTGPTADLKASPNSNPDGEGYEEVEELDDAGVEPSFSSLNAEAHQGREEKSPKAGEPSEGKDGM